LSLQSSFNKFLFSKHTPLPHLEQAFPLTFPLPPLSFGLFSPLGIVLHGELDSIPFCQSATLRPARLARPLSQQIPNQSNFPLIFFSCPLSPRLFGFRPTCIFFPPDSEADVNFRQRPTGHQFSLKSCRLFSGRLLPSSPFRFLNPAFISFFFFRAHPMRFVCSFPLVIFSP